MNRLSRLSTTLGSLALFLVTSSNAGVISRDFCIEIENIEIVYPWEETPEGVSIVETYGPPARVGQLFRGRISYDNTDIPQTGNLTREYYMGIPIDKMEPISELFVSYQCPFYGNDRIGDVPVESTLFFEEGILTDFNLRFNQDLQYFLDYETIGERYFGSGDVYFTYDYPGGREYAFAECLISGNVHFPVPEPGLLLLSTIGCVWICAARKNKKSY